MKKSMVEHTEKPEKDQSHKEKVSTYCGIIMMLATAVYFIWSFVFYEWEYSWISFVLGGLGCGIVSLIYRHK